MLDRWRPEEEGFTQLGAVFDEKLTMEAEVDDLANQCCWKMRTLLRPQRFVTLDQLVQQFRSHALPFVEHSTPAFYNATATRLQCPTQLSSGMLGSGGPNGRHFQPHPAHQRPRLQARAAPTFPFRTAGAQYNVAVVSMWTLRSLPLYYYIC